VPAQENSARGLLIGGAVLVGGYFLVKKFVRTNIEIPLQTKRYVERMRIGKVYAVKFKDDVIEFKFPIENPNNRPMTIDAIVGDIFVPDRNRRPLKLGTIAHYGHDVIKPLGSTDFDLVVRVKLVNEFVYLSQLFNGQVKRIAATFIGTVNANNRPWPVKETIQIA